jgi:hypothetical protein
VYAIPSGYQGVRELMGHDRDEKPQSPHHPYDPIGIPVKPGIEIWENSRRQGPGDQHCDNEPTYIEANLEPQELEKFYPLAEHSCLQPDPVELTDCDAERTQKSWTWCRSNTIILFA